MASAPIGVSTTKQTFAQLLQEFLKDSRLFVDALEELQGQISTVESLLEAEKGRRQPKEQSSNALTRALELAHTDRFQQYVEGTLDASPPQPHLAAGIDANLKFLAVLCQEMSGYADKMESIQEDMKESMLHAMNTASNPTTATATEKEAGVEACADDGLGSQQSACDEALLAAGVVDSVHSDVLLVKKICEAVSIITPSAEISSYVVVLRIQPYFATALVDAVMAWRS